MNLQHEEASVYEKMWTLDSYAEFSPGETFIPLFHAMSGMKTTDSVLDAGCGAGKGALALRHSGHVGRIHLCDITDEGLVPEARHDFLFTRVCLWSDLYPQLPFMLGRRFDWAICCDVMEHIPEAFTMLVVERLLSVTRKGVFFSICFEQDQMGTLIGKSLHHTVQPFTWWRDCLKELGHMKECRDLVINGVFLVEPR